MTGLLEAGKTRADARQEYLAVLRISKVFLDEYDAIITNYDEATSAMGIARDMIEEYFSDNIIHKDISVESAEDGSWMQLPILGDRMEIYARSPEEVQLIEQFLGRRADDLAALRNDYDDRYDEWNNWFKPYKDSLSSKTELNHNLDLAEYEMRLASIKRSLEYVRFLQGFVDYRNSIG